MKNEKVKQKMKDKHKMYESLMKFLKPTKGKFIITLLFIITATIGFLGVPPFAYFTEGGGITTKLSFLVTGPLYPLIFLMEIKNIEISVDRFGFIGSLTLIYIILLTYYYTLTCLLVFIYKKFIGIRWTK